ncbi:conserved protein of unknown function [Denitratisoma oestradiolicum]|uniref:Uncharacterized protein n=1 Tax=Denitratisoma oestradiolicum TaxID=311182 RepID=A0A6S6XTL5_9PROT|nr:conserved protein of unknown function [Denitratisoma oestradiolicum]
MDSALKYAATGSSPRMRGTRGVVKLIIKEERFIPAHAGNTLVVQQRQSSLAVHPRACGEHADVVAFVFRNLRFIPAHAGNT